MRLWHYRIIKYLPDKQLLAQWRELNSIYKKQDKHILINYIYEYPYEDLYAYSIMVVNELHARGILPKKWDNFNNYFNNKIRDTTYLVNYVPFKKHHNDRYLLQCFYNLEEKYDRGQKDFNYKRYADLKEFIKKHFTFI